jgi:hypothetical protein
MSHLAQVCNREKIDIKIGVHIGPLTLSVRRSTALVNHENTSEVVQGPFTLEAYGEALQGSYLLVDNCDVDRIHISMGVYVRVYNVFSFEQVSPEARLVNRDYRLSITSQTSEEFNGVGVLEFSYYLHGKKSTEVGRTKSAIYMPRLKDMSANHRRSKSKEKSKRLSVFNHASLSELPSMAENDGSNETYDMDDESSEEESLTARTIKVIHQ